MRMPYDEIVRVASYGVKMSPVVVENRAVCSLLDCHKSWRDELELFILSRVEHVANQSVGRRLLELPKW